MIIITDEENAAKEYVARLIGLLKDGGQCEVYRYVLEHGQAFRATAPSKELLALVKEFNHFNIRKKACFYNSQMLTVESNGVFKYYEGWASTNLIGIPFEHGFNVYKGQVVDVTWQDGKDYFGLEIPLVFIRNFWDKTGMSQGLLGEYLARIIPRT